MSNEIQEKEAAIRRHQMDESRSRIREAYGQVALSDQEGESFGVVESCCGVSQDDEINALISTRLGYSRHELATIPDGADLGLGCGNPKAIADLRAGEVVVDLGAGGGLDCFLAAAEVGREGRVIGVDMTPDMLTRARANAAKGGFENVEFRLGEIEHLPIADATADVIISNCVINLSPDKGQVFRDAFRVLKPGGRLAISDVVATVELPEEVRTDAALVASCIGRAAQVDEIRTHLDDAGFEAVRIAPNEESREFIKDWAPGRGIENYVVSATIAAVKPASGQG